jgi:hypothetical protein
MFLPVSMPRLTFFDRDAIDLQRDRQLLGRIGCRLEQFGDRRSARSRSRSVMGRDRFEVSQLRLQRLDAFLEHGDLSGDKRPGGLKGASMVQTLLPLWRGKAPRQGRRDTTRKG